MRIVYCIHSTYNSGGMERILSIKANYLCEKLGYEVYIVTTDQGCRSNFFEFSNKIKFIDLSVRYLELEHIGLFKKVYLYYRKKKEHEKKMRDLLFRLRVDIVISMFERELSFLYKIKDGSAKVCEIHFSKFVRLQKFPKGIMKLISLVNTYRDEFYAKKYDKFIVLTYEDLHYWSNCKNIQCIPNPSIIRADKPAILKNKKVLAIGRLCYQKGFDLLITAWQLVHQQALDWELHIYGEGNLKDYLEKLIEDLNMKSCISIHAPNIDVKRLYQDSSIFAFSSRYEGFGLVLVEAMSCGIPVVSFDCKCGPKDIILDNYNGLLVPENDVQSMAMALLKLISDENLRKQLGYNALLSSDKYTVDNIMSIWNSLFLSLK